MADFEQIKTHLRDYLDSHGQRADKGDGYDCPLCGSGKGSHKTSAFRVDDAGTHWICYSCGKRGDLIDLIGNLEHLDPSSAAKRAIGLYGDADHHRSEALAWDAVIDDGEQPPDQSKAQPREQPKLSPDQIAAKVRTWADALPDSPGMAYMEQRGFSADFCQSQHIGFDPRAWDPQLKAARPAIIIPYNPELSYYAVRYIDDCPDGLRYNKPSRSDAGPEPIFEAAAIHNGHDAVFVVEGQLDALAIMAAGYPAISTGGTSGYKQLCKAIKDHPTPALLLLCYDADAPGEAATADALEALDKVGANVADVAARIMQPADVAEQLWRKDPGDVLQSDGLDTLKARLADAHADALEALADARAEREAATGGGILADFLTAIQTEAYKPLPTGIEQLDALIGGGLMRQQITTIGGAPGMGKTALAAWIAESIAEHGQECVYINLEMSKEQLLARSLSRLSHRRGTPISPLAILQGYNWTDRQRKIVMATARDYQSLIGSRMQYNPADVTADLDSIISYLYTMGSAARRDGKPAPVAIVDYLQIIRGNKGEDAATTIKRAVSQLKTYAVEDNAAVILIVAHNRESNRTGSVTMESGRDTSAIEYNADLQLGLAYTACLANRGTTPDELTDAERQAITIKVTKARWVPTGRTLDLAFEAKGMTFKPA